MSDWPKERLSGIRALAVPHRIYDAYGEPTKEQCIPEDLIREMADWIERWQPVVEAARRQCAAVRRHNGVVLTSPDEYRRRCDETSAAVRAAEEKRHGD